MLYIYIWGKMKDFQKVAALPQVDKSAVTQGVVIIM